MPLMSLYTEFRERELIAQCTHPDELERRLASGEKLCMYTGFDPTADSLHIGHLIPVMGLARARRAGHKIIALVGGATALVGDPSGKSSMRQMLSAEDIHNNAERIRSQLSRFVDIDGQGGVLENNLNWLGGLKYLELLREVGVHFSVNRMLTAECFKARLEQGLSFLEFNYMILQAYDFLELQRKHNCVLQLGGDDQWSNMLAGVELIRRSGGAQAYALTYPLLTTSDGRKMGKTEKGAVWLDAARTSPYEYFQYWRNVPDDRVRACLRYFTFLPNGEIDAMLDSGPDHINQTKEVLAFEATKIAHGESEAQAARQSARAAFGGGAAADLPTTEIDAALCHAGLDIVELLRHSGLAPSNKEARRLIEGGGVYLDGERVDQAERRIGKEKLMAGIELRKGKKVHQRIIAR